MDRIVILCLLSLVLTAVGMFFLWADDIGRNLPPVPLGRALRSKKTTTTSAAMLALLLGVSAALALLYGNNSLLLDCKLLILIAVLFLAAIIDAKWFVIPNLLILFAFGLRAVIYCIEFITLQSAFWAVLKEELIGCLIPVFFLLIGVLAIKNGIGMGDIKLLLVMALYQGVSGVFSSVFISLIIAFANSVIFLIFKKKSRKDAVAFAPSLLIGTAISVILTGM